MKKIVEISHNILEDYLTDQSVAIDFTVGHGSDTSFLASRCKEVYGFDILEDAIQEVSDMKLGNHVHLYCENHLNFTNYLQSYDVGIFNFGYFPGGDESNTTLLENSKKTVSEALNALKKRGILLLVCYIGHEEGMKEGEYFKSLAKEIDPHLFRSFLFEMQNTNHAPFILGIERIREGEYHAVS